MIAKVNDLALNRYINIRLSECCEEIEIVSTPRTMFEPRV